MVNFVMGFKNGGCIIDLEMVNGVRIGIEHGHSPLHLHSIAAFGLEQITCFRMQLFG